MFVMRWGTGTLNHRRVQLTDRILGRFCVGECAHFNPVGQSSGEQRQAGDPERGKGNMGRRIR